MNHQICVGLSSTYASIYPTWVLLSQLSIPTFFSKYIYIIMIIIIIINNNTYIYTYISQFCQHYMYVYIYTYMFPFIRYPHHILTISCLHHAWSHHRSMISYLPTMWHGILSFWASYSDLAKKSPPMLRGLSWFIPTSAQISDLGMTVICPELLYWSQLLQCPYFLPWNKSAQIRT